MVSYPPPVVCLAVIDEALNGKRIATKQANGVMLKCSYTSVNQQLRAFKEVERLILTRYHHRDPHAIKKPGELGQWDNVWFLDLLR